MNIYVHIYIYIHINTYIRMNYLPTFCQVTILGGMNINPIDGSAAPSDPWISERQRHSWVKASDQIWLVVWNITFIFPYIWEIHPN